MEYFMGIARGDHSSNSELENIMERVSRLSGGPKSSYPEMCSPVIAAFLRGFNDDCADYIREKLNEIASKLLNTRGAADVEERRALWILNWLVRGHLYYWTKDCGPLSSYPIFDDIKQYVLLHNNLDLNNIIAWRNELELWQLEMSRLSNDIIKDYSVDEVEILSRTGVYAASESSIYSAILDKRALLVWGPCCGAVYHLITSMIRIFLFKERIFVMEKVVFELEQNSVFKMLNQLIEMK